MQSEIPFQGSVQRSYGDCRAIVRSGPGNFRRQETAVQYFSAVSVVSAGAAHLGGLRNLSGIPRSL